jgi:hypothetical protein
MIRHDFWTDRASVFLSFLFLACHAHFDRRRVLVIDLRAIGVNRPYLCADELRSDTHRAAQN